MASIVVAGDTSGTISLTAPAVAGTTTLTLPTTSGTIITTGGGAAGSFTTLTSTQGASFATSSGNVGIGTSSPSVKLDVNAGTTSGTSFDALVLKGGANSTSGSGAKLFLSGGVGTARAAVIQGLATDNANAHAMVFYTNQASTDPVERMRIDSSGKLVMASTTDGLIGSIQAGITANTASTNAVIVAAATANGPYPIGARGESTSQGLVGFFNSSNSVIGSITKSGNNVAYNTSSDYRLKENIAPMTGALDKVAKLNPVIYTWKSDGSNGQGFIAHELQEVVPDAVTGEKDAVNEDGSIKAQGVDTSFLVATLTAAIQELTAKVKELEAKVNQ